MSRSRTISTALVVLIIASIGFSAAGAPIIPTEKKPEDSVLSLGKVKQVEVVVDHLAPELRTAGVNEEEIKTRWTKRLEEEHFEVADGKGYPKLVLKSVTTIDQDVPNAVAYVLVMRFEQPVRIDRLDETLFVPTYSETLLGQETVTHLGHAAILNATRAVDLFIDSVKKANKSQQQ